MKKTIAFDGCWVHLDDDARFIHTAFPDGRCLTGVPVPEKDIETARRYGYGDDYLRLWREHDVLHHCVASFFGHPHSPTIWSECHEDHPAALPRWARLAEEDFVGHIHRWLNRNLWVPELCALLPTGADFETSQTTARKRLGNCLNQTR